MGLSDAQNVVVVDYLPAEVEFVWADEAPESPIGASAATTRSTSRSRAIWARCRPE